MMLGIDIHGLGAILSKTIRGSIKILYLVAILYLGYHGNGRHFEFFQTPQKLLHTTVDIPTHFHEV
jgi:hypothetical protein